MILGPGKMLLAERVLGLERFAFAPVSHRLTSKDMFHSTLWELYPMLSADCDRSVWFNSNSTGGRQEQAFRQV